jgi:translocation and assembly module TamB
LPKIRNTRGELTGQLQLLGAVEQPKFVSDLTLSNGSFEIPEYGISPQQVYIELMSDDEQNLQVTASAISGNGDLNFIGQAASLYSSERIFELTLSGDNFELINNAGTHMLASPDLRLNFQEGILDIQGKVTIPELDIDIRDASTILLNNGIDVSRDVVIINAPPEQANLLNSNQSDFMEIPVTANLELELGNNVHFQGLGLVLMLSGNLQAQQDLDRPLVAYGDISIAEGFYEIYGQRLDVTNGKMIFFGNISNPALDIRAYRQDSSIQAGVQINGTLRNMQSQLFSTPSLPESEILSILITGKSYADNDNQEQNNILGAVASLGINRGSGITSAIRSELGLDTLELNSQSNLDQSSLGLGKYLTPDIFMHYEIGLFERESTLSLDYILSERLRLEVESGISQSIDMTFTVEK